MTITKNHNGSLTVSKVINGYLYTKTYYGYTKKEAVSLYTRETKGGK
jgi:hypothetical protein